jgi:hypothetical protein
MSDHYILVGQTPVPCELLEWARAFEDGEQRRVALWKRGPVRVSTVFLGLDHNMANYFGSCDEPHLFETMVFFLGASVWQDRCATWLQAEAMHGEAVRYVCTMWRRPRELADWIREGVEHWMRAWDYRFAARYSRAPWMGAWRR